MEEIWSLHSDYGDGCSYISGNDSESDTEGASRLVYCRDCGMPTQSTTGREQRRPTTNHAQQPQLENLINVDLPLATTNRQYSSSITSTLADHDAVFALCGYEPDTELIQLIQQLESERFELLARDEIGQEGGEVVPRSNGWHTGPLEDFTQLPASDDYRETQEKPAYEGVNWLRESSSEIVPSARRRTRIKQLDRELTKLRQLQAMEERSLLRQSARSLKATRSVSTATTPGSSISSRHRETTSSTAETRSATGSMQQPDLLLATMSTLFDVDKEKMTAVLAQQCMSRDQCFLLYQQNVIPIVIRLIHDPMCGISTSPPGVRVSAGTVLFQLVSCQADDKRGRREGRVLNWLEEVRTYSSCIIYPDFHQNAHYDEELEESAPYSALVNLRRYSAEEEYRHAICFLGGLNAVAELVQCDFLKFDNTNSPRHVSMRQFACMILTNLSFGDGCNKALLCSSASFLETLVHLLSSPNEDLRLCVAMVIRNISWRADVTSKRNLRDSKVVSYLLRASMQGKSETSLKTLLSALSNLSAHNDDNRQEICAFDGALPFLIRHLQYKSNSHPQTHEVQEYSGCILRSISNVIAVRPEYRTILRENGCLEVVVEHLRSPTIALVANACGILWNLSARCVEDQQRLWELQAVPLLENLSRSTHESIASASAKAVKNLRKAREGFHGLHAKGAERTAGNRKIRTVGARNGRPDEQIQSADDYDAEEAEKPRNVNSVPSSPMITPRSARVNASYRSVTNVTSDRLIGNQQRDRSVQLMAAISRQVAGDSSGPSRKLASPPLSPQKSHQNGAFPHFSHHTSHFPSDEQTRAWNDSSANFHQNPAELGGFQDFPPFELDSTRDHQENSDKIPEEESNDECIDFGSRFNAETTARQQVEVDEIRTYTTEYGDSRDGEPSVASISHEHATQLQSVFPDTPSTIRGSQRHFAPRQVSIGDTSVLIQTPMACSRSSTPSALSDLDTVTGEDILEKQSVYSQSGMLTPTESEIPASPSLMRSSPKVMKRRILPAPPVQREESAPPAAAPQVKEESIQTAPEEAGESWLDVEDVIKNVGGLSLRRKGKKDKSGSGNFLKAPLVPAVPVAPVLPPQHHFPVPQLSGGYFESESQIDDVRTFASEGLSGGTSVSNLTISPISGISVFDVPRDHGVGIKQLPPLPPKPTGFLTGSSSARQQFFSQIPESNPPIFPETAPSAPKVNPEPETTASIEAVQESGNSDVFAFKWPVPPVTAPPLPRRVSSLPPSPSQALTAVQEVLLTPSKSNSQANGETDENHEEKGDLEAESTEAPPLPPPFHPQPPEAAQDAPSSLPLPVEPNAEKPAELFDAIYGILPRRHKAGKKRVPKGQRKAQLAACLSGISAIPHSASANLAPIPPEKPLSNIPTRSRSSHQVSSTKPGASGISGPSVSREGLVLKNLKKAQPDCPDAVKSSSGGTSMWVDLNGPTAVASGDFLRLPKVPEVPAVKNEAYEWNSDLDSDDEKAGKQPVANVHTSQPRPASPDVFDTISQMGANLSSHFSSEASDADDEAPRRPKIVKPKISGGGAEKHNGANFDAGRSPKPVKGGSKKPVASDKKKEVSRPVNGQSEQPCPTAVGVSNVSVHQEEVTPPRLMKQGTFTKENGPTSMAPPWIFPDSDFSKQTQAARHRYASVTRGPRESCSSVSSADGGRGKSAAPGAPPRARSARSSSRAPAPVPTVSVSDVITAVPPPVALEIPASNGTPKTHRKKSVPVASKIASLWRGDKKTSEKTPKNGSQGEAVGKKTWKKNGEPSSHGSVKSPTLSERLKPSRNFFSVAPRKTATLPKKSHASTGLNGGGQPTQAATEKSSTSKKGAFTVTTV